MRSRRPGMRGQALTEFALVAPIFLALLFAIFDFGRVIWATNSLANAAREGARFAVVHGASKSTACPVGPTLPERQVPAPSSTCPHPSPSDQMVKDVVLAHAVAGGAPISVAVCYGEGCTGDVDVPDTYNERGTPVTVTVTSSVGLVTGSLVGLGVYTISSTSTMLINN